MRAVRHIAKPSLAAALGAIRVRPRQLVTDVAVAGSLGFSADLDRHLKVEEATAAAAAAAAAETNKKDRSPACSRRTPSVSLNTAVTRRS